MLDRVSPGSAASVDDAGVPKTWTAAEIRAIPEIRFNRNTERHAKVIVKKKYDRDDPMYAVGFMTVFIKSLGKTVRLNGNTRCYCDKHNLILLPDKVSGTHFVVDTWDEALALYEKIDNKAAGKGAKDQLDTALRFNRINVKSDLFSTAGGTSGIVIAWNALHGLESNGAPEDKVTMVADLRDPIIAVDTLLAEHDVSNGKIATHAAVVTAMLLTYLKTLHGKVTPRQREIAANDWAGFWGTFYDNRGEGHTQLPANKAWAVVKELSAGGQRKEIYMIAGKVLDCFKRREEERIRNVLRHDLSAYHPVNAEDVEEPWER